MVLWPFAFYALCVFLLVGLMLFLSWVLGERHQGRAMNAPYEGGILSTGSARVRFPARFYLIGMFFVVFDLEAAFLFAWAVAGRTLGWPGYLEMLVFVAVLLVALLYLWRVGALDLSTGASRGEALK